MLNVILGHEGLLPCLYLEELLIHMLPMSTNLLSIVLPNVEASKEPTALLGRDGGANDFLPQKVKHTEL